METLTLPATRWLYIPTRYDDPFVRSLAPNGNDIPDDDPGDLTPYVYGWGCLWLKENGYERSDLPIELEIYGLYDGYDHDKGGPGANLTLAIPMV